MPNICGENYYCNTQVGECKCDKGWQGSDCLTKFIQCPTASDNNEICGNRGTCFNQTGVCSCFDEANNSPSCNQCPNPFCSGYGKCNYLTTLCECFKGPFSYQGQNCSTPSIYVSSINPSPEEGGTAILGGWFGVSSFNSQIKVYINSKECSITSINSTTISCNAKPGSGFVSISIQHQLITWSKSSYYRYLPSSVKCLNDCNISNNGGACDTKSGYCLCNDNWDGLDCSIKLNENNVNKNNSNNPKTDTTIDDQTGIVQLYNQNTNYKISIISLLEISYDGSISKTTQISNQWSNITVNKNQDGNLVYNFTATIQKDSNNQTLSAITYLVEEIQKNKLFSFGGIKFKVSAGSIKITTIISNYQFSSNLNTLKLLFESSVGDNLNNNSDKECNDPNVNINSINSADSNLNYITIKKDAKLLSGRFLDRIEIDQPGRYTFITSEVYNKTNSSLIVAVNLPHFSNFCTLDPDWSLLLSSEFKSTCKSDRKWFLPVVIVIPVVAISIIVVAFIILRRNRLGRLNFAIKMKNLVKK